MFENCFALVVGEASVTCWAQLHLQDKPLQKSSNKQLDFAVPKGSAYLPDNDRRCSESLLVLTFCCGFLKNLFCWGWGKRSIIGSTYQNLKAHDRIKACVYSNSPLAKYQAFHPFPRMIVAFTVCKLSKWRNGALMFKGIETSKKYVLAVFETGDVLIHFQHRFAFVTSALKSLNVFVFQNDTSLHAKWRKKQANVFILF